MTIQFLSNVSYPQNNEDEFPVGQEIIFIFSESVDIKKIKESFVLYGEDFDRTSGPDNSLWLNSQSGENPFFLRSPGFKGFVDYDVRQVLITSHKTMEERVSQLQYEPETDQLSAIVFTPKTLLRENSKYEIFLVGNNVDNLETLPNGFASLSKDRALSARTIFDAYSLDANNDYIDVSSRIKSYGSFKPKSNEVSARVNIKIITAGEGSSAKYKWWFDDELEPQPANPVYKNRVSRCVQRWRKLDRGVLVKFSLDSYEEDELFQINCVKSETLETSYLLTFQTGTGSIYEYPENSSTSPIGVGNLVLPGAIPNQVTGTPLEIVSVTPFDGSVNNPLDLNKIIIEFNKDLDATTITQDTVSITSYPISGTFDGYSGTRSDRERKVYKIISVEDNKLILEI